MRRRGGDGGGRGGGIEQGGMIGKAMLEKDLGGGRTRNYELKFWGGILNYDRRVDRGSIQAQIFLIY